MAATLRSFLFVALQLLHFVQPYHSYVRTRRAPSTTSSSLTVAMAGRKNAYASYLEKLVERKKVEVEQLLRQHQEKDDPIVMRMSYMNSESKFNVTNCIRRESFGKDALHTMSIVVDMKRRSPTIPERRNIVEYANAAKFADLLTLAGVDAFLMNTDEVEYGGKFSELKEVARSTKLVKPNTAPAIIQKDVIIHPVQIALAAEEGASGVLLIAGVVGGDLETLLDSCTIMGMQSVVEVHTPNELEFALSRGATIFLVNMWDRFTGQLFSEQAKGLSSMLPVNCVAIAAGDIRTAEQVAELGFYGYDGIVLGRGITEVPDIKSFIDAVHAFKGSPRGFGTGFKGLPF